MATGNMALPPLGYIRPNGNRSIIRLKRQMELMLRMEDFLRECLD